MTATGTDAKGHTASVDDEAAGTSANRFCIELTLFDGISSGLSERLTGRWRRNESLGSRLRHWLMELLVDIVGRGFVDDDG